MKSTNTRTNWHFGVMWEGKSFLPIWCKSTVNWKTKKQANQQTKQKGANLIFLWCDLFWTLREEKSFFSKLIFFLPSKLDFILKIKKDSKRELLRESSRRELSYEKPHNRQITQGSEWLINNDVSKFKTISIC